MPRYRIHVRDINFLEYEIETDLTDEEAIEHLFYGMSHEEQDAALVDKDPFEWAISEIEKMED